MGSNVFAESQVKVGSSVSSKFLGRTAISLEKYRSGAELFGDDFGSDDLYRWYEIESQAYAEMVQSGIVEPIYGYGAINRWLGYRYLSHVEFKNVLGVGGDNGEELEPVMKYSPSVTVLESRDGLSGAVRHVKSDPLGPFPFPDGTFDLVTCFGVLHHIANVSTVMKEIYRCLTPGGYALIREPIVSMGDWSGPRGGLTPCERGIPLPLFERILSDTGFVVERRNKCFFAPLQWLARKLHRQLYDSTPYVVLDQILAALPWPQRYHATRFWQKIRPQCVYFVLRKPDPSRTKLAHGKLTL